MFEFINQIANIKNILIAQRFAAENRYSVYVWLTCEMKELLLNLFIPLFAAVKIPSFGIKTATAMKMTPLNEKGYSQSLSVRYIHFSYF